MSLNTDTGKKRESGWWETVKVIIVIARVRQEKRRVAAIRPRHARVASALGRYEPRSELVEIDRDVARRR